jgi:hypothetical protein
MLRVMPEIAPLFGAEFDIADFAHVAYLLGIGLFAGIVAAMFGLGGGVVAVPALILAFGYFQDQFTATRATSLVMILPTSLVGASLHWRAGSVDKLLVVKVTPVAAAGAVVGVFIAYAVPQAGLQVIFAVLLLFAALRLLVKKAEKKSVEKVVHDGGNLTIPNPPQNELRAD